MKTITLHLFTLTAIVLALSACSQKSAEQVGKDMATEKIDIAKGIGTAMQEKGAAAGESVTRGAGNVIKGMERGILQSGRAIEVDASLAASGLQITTIQNSDPGKNGKTHGLDAYVIAGKASNGTLKVLVFDALDHEIGRASVPLVRATDEAKYQRIPFEEQVSLSAISKAKFSFEPRVDGQH